MAKKCCSCSRFFSCLSCFSRGNDPDALPPVEATSSDALPPAEGTASSDVLPPVEGASSSDALPPVEGISSSDALPHVEGAASSDVPAVMEIPSVGTSSSATEGAASSDVPAVMEIPSVGTSSSAIAVGTSSSAIEEGDVDDVDLDALLEDVSNLLEQIKEGTKSSHKKTKPAQQYLPTTSKSFNKLKEFLSEAANFVKDIVPGDAIKTVASGILQGMGMAHLATAGLVVVVSILERFDEVSANKTECLRLLREMIFLAKLVKQFKERSQLKETMHDVIREATELIVEGSIKCLAQMKSSNFSKFFSTSANKGDLESFTKQLDDQYKHIYAQMGISFFDIHAQMGMKAPISRGYPEHAVGVEEPVKEVTDLLDWASEENALAIMLHGFGGMGKTTLANAVFSLLDLKGYKYSKVQLFKYIGSTPDIVKLQKQILKDLMEPQDSIPDIRTPEDGQQELVKALEKQTAFIYIDNVLGENELRQLLPKDIKKAKKLRLLLTARDENVRRGCPVKTLTYNMRSIPSAEAMSLLRKELSNGMAGNLSATQLNRIMEICGGIPLMLTLATGVIRCEADKQKAYRIVMHDRQKMKGQTFGDTDHYLFAFDSLPDTCKDPFLDICSFFSGWDWNTVADIVGETELDILERRALVTKGKDGVACIHDVISTIGLQKTEKLRFKFTSASEVEELLNSNENKFIKAIKGVWLSENKDRLHLNASKLDLMHSSLRVLALGNLINVAGECKKVFKNLAFFQAGIPHLPFDILKAKKLAFLSYEPATSDLAEMPSNLKHIEFHGRPHSDALEISSGCLKQLHNLRILRLISFVEMRKLPEELGDLVKSLEELSLSSCEALEELPGSTSNLKSLKVLKTDHCSNLKRLPEGFSKLQSLEVLRMDYCSSLEQLTEDFGALNSLQELNLEGCTDLQVLPKNFEKLSSLKLLNLSSCTRLEELPLGLGNLKSLVTLDLCKCEKLKKIPESIGQLQSLSSSMVMSYCSSLTELPDAFCNLSVITHLSLSGCKSLHRLPDHFEKLANLRELNLKNCTSLERLPDGFGLLVFLEELNLAGCEKLGELCNDFPCLSSLRIMYLDNCQCLKKLPEDFDRLVALQLLYLCGCDCLENLPENFYCLPSLETLHLHDCPMLEGKCMDHLIKIKKLQHLYIQRSRLLLKRWAEIQREGDQSWPFKVYSGQDLSEEEATNMQKKFLSDLDGLLTPGKGDPFPLSNCPPNTSILIMLDNRAIFNFDRHWPLIEETLNDIQIKFEIVYIGKHFDKLPLQVGNKILGYALLNSEVTALIGNLYRASQLKVAPDSQSDEDDWDEDGDIIYMQWSAMIVGDRKDDRYLSYWKCLSKRQMEEFVVAKCGKFLRLKQLAETNQESNIEILREMFATREEESTDHIFQKTCASHKARSEDSKTFTCGIDELKGKTIILDIRHVEVCYDVRLESLAEMYITAKERLGFETISIPILPPRTKGDVLEIVERFSSEVPWLVLQNPWTIATTVKYFLLKQCSWEEHEQLGQQDKELEAYYPSIIWMLESNGRVTNYKHFVIPILDRWGAKCYPFEDGKIKKLRKEEWEKKKNMSSLEFLFTHLENVSEQVKEILLQRKMICLYGGDQRINESTCSTITELRNMIHIIYIPNFDWEDEEQLLLTYTTCMQYRPLKKPHIPDMSNMEGIPLLILSEHETMRFWTRLSSLREEIYEMDNWTTQLDGLEKLLDSFERSNSWLTLVDKDGEMVTDRRKEIVHNLIVGDNSEDKEKELLLQEFLHMFKQEDRNEEGRFSEEPMDEEEQHKFQEKIELCNSVADSMPGELQGESGIPSAKASLTAGQEEYMTSASSSAPNA